MTGFTDNEYALARFVSLALSKGVPESAFGFGGWRSVGPSVTMCKGGYRINSNAGECNGRSFTEQGIFLGRTFREAKERVRVIYREHKGALTEIAGGL